MDHRRDLLEKVTRAFARKYVWLSDNFFHDRNVCRLTPRRQEFLSFLITNGFCDGTSCYEMPSLAVMMYNKETVGDSLDEFLQKVAQLEPLASCEVVNEQISDDNFRTMLWINIPKVKKWMKVRRPNKIHKRQIKSYSDLRAEFGQD